ncbi:MAG: hypothetical protein COV47_03860 [Candidatus Diapherotrites archaeon CG11_big_fil_rev_8_21_14_0_20_37_9]|nr:MAG: hypothetical protein COV47_03860 [Candidatus Diapherotrites archaeon CG11_big_fil_rev_8_21_14_0_20_37_9]
MDKNGINNLIMYGVIGVALVFGLFIALSISNQPQETVTTKAEIGASAPNFSLKTLDGKTINLSEYKGKNVVLFFNEGSMCYPSCWNQIKELAMDERFNNSETVSFSVVVDEMKNWRKITQQFPEFSASKLIFDITGETSKNYGALDMPSSMHGGMMPGHTYYIIDKEGTLRFVYDDPMMGIRNDLISGEIAKLN